MFHFLSILLVSKFTLLNIFKYITFRSFCALLTTFVIGMVCYPQAIKKLKTIQKGGQPIRSDGPSSHLKTKSNTPTMGGIILLGSAALGTLLWADLKNVYIWLALFTMVLFAIIGFIDDYRKLTLHNSSGMNAKTKLLWQFLSSAAVAFGVMYISRDASLTTALALPFFKEVLLNLGCFYIPFMMLIIVGSSNAVNLTDGLDGLAIGCVLIAMSCFALITYIVGHAVFSDYLQIYHIQGVGELTVFCTSIIGAGLAFLWYNAHPAQIFMGDVGSLALGAIIGFISIITKHELVLILIGGLFVIEAMSVILQVGYFKLSRKRIFRMAPIHHHFEKLGWSESAIVIRFWIIASLFALIGLATMKLR
jgi:phospho-N-acetylmuramoyl-pentapeptide-transferase